MTATPTVTATQPSLYAHRSGSGEPLVLLHGLGESHVGWRPVIDTLARNYDVIALDMPGFGRSAPLPLDVPPTAANVAAVVERTLDELGVTEYHVAGYSLGARIALQLARSERVRSIVAIGPDGLGTPAERVAGFVGLAAGRALAMALAPVAGELSQTAAGRTVFFAGNRSRPWQLQSTDAEELLTGFATAPSYDLVNWISMFDFATHLHTIKQPVLFLQGTADPLTAQVLRYLTVIPRADLRLLPGANHVPISDDPKAVATAIHEFLQRP